MFGLGSSEIILIIIVAIILFNPKDLPGIVRKLGNIYGYVLKEFNCLRKTYGQFENEIESLGDLDIKN